jgi:uncharacterized membrane protein YphA (DoxX/SURF4 family)
VLGITFLWAGLGKIEGEFSVQGDTAATLASMGVDRLREEGLRNLRATQPSATQPSSVQTTPAPAQPPTVAPGGPPAPDRVGPPRPEPEASAPANGPTSQPDPSSTTPTQPVQTEPTPAETTPTPPAPSARATHAPRAPLALPTLAQNDLAQLTLAQVTAPPPNADAPSNAAKPEVVYHAGLFPQPVSIKRLYRLSLLISRAANPATPPPAAASASPNSAPVAIVPERPRKLMPSFFSRGSRPVALAWFIAIGEVIAGSLLLMGLLTRVASIFCVGLMVGAIWLTELGPAIQAGNTMLGFLPNRELWDPELWKTLLWQCALLASSVTLALTGSGVFGLDRRLFPDAPPPPPRPRPML